MDTDNAIYLREWAANIRKHSGKSVDADRCDAIADEMEQLRSRLPASPLPDEIADLCEWINLEATQIEQIVGDGTCSPLRKISTVLQAQNQRIRELDAELERFSTPVPTPPGFENILENAGRFKEIALERRIRELEDATKYPLPGEIAALEAERDLALRIRDRAIASTLCSGQAAAHFKAERDAIAAASQEKSEEIARLEERLNRQRARTEEEAELYGNALNDVDAIRAKTIEECAALVQAMANKLKPGPVTDDGKLMHAAWLDASDSIRALNQPAKPSAETEDSQ